MIAHPISRILPRKLQNGHDRAWPSISLTQRLLPPWRNASRPTWDKLRLPRVSRGHVRLQGSKFSVRWEQRARRLILFPIFLIPAAVTVCAGNTGIAATPGWREEFKAMSPGWEVRGKPGVKAAVFQVSQPVAGDGSRLVMEADQASASLLMKLDAVDLRQTPILRWRWSVTTFPRNADGRDAGKDDQAIGIYVNTGSLLNQHSIAYRWETDTPVGGEGKVTYAAGLVKVKWFCLRNRKDGDGKTFLIEERNVAEDFKKAFGFIPKKIGIGISCNSQYTASQAAAELDWIELLPRPTNAAAKPPAAR